MKVGILGAGQLCKMLISAGLPLGIEFKVFAPKGDHCIPYHKDVVLSAWDDYQGLSEFARACDVVTLESENIPKEVALHTQTLTQFAPNGTALSHSQDRLLEKKLFDKLQIPNVPYAKVDTLEELQAFIEAQSYPVILKKSRFGYDGKGQWRLDSSLCVTKLEANQLKDCIVEKAVAFEREVSIIGCRSADELKFYDLCENSHHQGILHHSQNMPQDHNWAAACELLTKILLELDYIGCCTLELFEIQGKLFANEMAPRVHNSGHWTIEGAHSSQFENHIRAICNLPLGNMQSRSKTHMINILGSWPDTTRLLQQDLHVHDYGKSYKPNRKRGHVTSTFALEPAHLEQLVKICAFENSKQASLSLEF